MIKQRLYILLRVFMSVLLMSVVSCTGTIEDSELETTEFGDQKPLTFNYKGLKEARAVAHNKFEVDLEPYRNNFNNYTYELYINEGSVPIIVDPNNLSEKSAGVYTYTVKDLLPNTYYSFKLRAKHVTDGTESSGENTLSGIQYKTFDNQVASFGGVGEVSLIPGAASSSIQVKWTPGLMEGVFTLNPSDAAYYEVIVIDESLGLANMNNPFFSGVGKIVQLVPDTVDLSVGASPAGASPLNNPTSTTINGLNADTTYYVQVRAIHKLYYDAQLAGTSPIPFDKDSNTLVRKITTTGSNTITDIPRDSLILNKGSGVDAYSKIQASWLPAEGNFKSYRVYYTEYNSGTGGDQLRPSEDIYADVGDTCEVNVANEIQCVSANTFTTNSILTFLDDYTEFQIKVAVCLTDECPVQPVVPNAAVFTDPQTITTEANLVDFAGINFINHPNDPANTDEIIADFDAVVLGDGFADSLDLICIDPDDTNNFVLFPRDGTAITGSSIANCDGLSVKTMLNQNLQDVSDANIEGINQLVIKNVNNINTSTFAQASYCFALNPSIRLKTQQVFASTLTSIVRCISPEIAVPSQEEFVGLKTNCAINVKDATVSWALPTDGVYNKFEVFYKEKNQNSFSFELATAGDAAYTSSGLLDGADVDYTFEGDPGKVYEVGVLAVAESGSGNLYSEYNLGVTNCSIEMPEATFNEWTRVFAVGPRIDGRYNFEEDPDNFSTAKPEEAFKLEQFTTEGRVVEITPPEYNLPPGHYSSDPTQLGSLFDGKANGDGIAASKTGIISFAWKAINLNALQTEFENGQDLGSRPDREFGYKVYRSDDNRISWSELTTESGLIHQGDYSYYLLSSSEANRTETDKMAFFTDYSVRYSESNDYVDRARIYWYRIVPVFQDKELEYSEKGIFPPNEIKIVLPPPNVALVNRRMANRQGCLNLGKAIDKGDYYSCDYDGIGSVAKSSPWKVGQTKLDLSGDLFIDRNELGCQYTRGSRSPNPQDTSSYFKDNGRDEGNWNNAPSSQSIFQGFSNTGSIQVGCMLNNLHLENGGLLLKTSNSSDFSADDATFENHLFGDCSGGLVQKANSQRVKAGSFASSYVTYNLPAASYQESETPSGADPNRNVHFSNPDEADFAGTGFLDEDWEQNLMVQSENLAVFYNDQSSGYLYSPFGPQVNNVDATQSFRVVEADTSSVVSNNCYINLAAVGTDTNWKARWFPTNHLDQIKEDEDPNNTNKVDIYAMTVTEVKSVPSLYRAGSNYRTISDSFLNEKRLNADSPISRIFSANHAKLPPLTGLTSQQYNKVCGTYSIQVGIESSGSFVPLSAPHKKRLPRRNEIILSSEWTESPQFYDTNEDINIEDVESDRVSAGGSCNGDFNNSPSEQRDPGNPLLADGLESGYFSGSSAKDVPDNRHSELCVSKYGVQDLVGNYAETESQRLFCDFSLDKLYLGKFELGMGEISESVEINNMQDTYFLKNITVLDKDGNPILAGNDWLPYEVVDQDSGYCSIVDDDLDQFNSSANYRDLEVFKNVFNPDGTANDDMIKRELATDQSAVNFLRNGDGTFLSTGSFAILPPLKEGNEFSLTNSTEMRGKYFSPIVGLPLLCGGNPDNDSCGLQGSGVGSDNTIVSTQRMIDKYFPGQEDDFIIMDTLGSNIPKNFATEAVTGGPDPADLKSVLVNGVGQTNPTSFGSQSVRVITQIQLNDDVDLNNIPAGTPIAEPSGYTITEMAVSELPAGQTHEIMHVKWTSDRNESIRLRSGGHHNSSSNGRFKLDFHQTETDRTKTGRCSVLINTDNL
jgi:hypothetical protein